ncbi:MAG: hypothetical protein NTU89_04510 [Candidatus Dependentiae bacterium]|nr:hypothetical protein [Candidatus Dependentiae bacterium]
MKRFLIICFGLLVSCFSIFSDIKLGTVYNHSDLTLTQVSTVANNKRNKGLTAQLKIANKQNQNSSTPVFKTHIFNHSIGTSSSGYASFQAQDQHKNKYDILLSVNPSHSVQFGRTRATPAPGRPGIAKEVCDISDGNQCAQVVIKKNGNVIFTNALAYDVDNPEEEVDLNMSLLGSNGIYTARLDRANN